MICTKCSATAPQAQSNSCAHCGKASNFRLCQTCSRGKNQCEVCRNGMQGYNPGCFFITARDADNKKSKKLKTGEELHIHLDESQGSGSGSWNVQAHPSCLGWALSEVNQDQSSPPNVTRSFVFCARGPGKGPVKVTRGSQTWELQVTVK